MNGNGLLGVRLSLREPLRTELQTFHLLWDSQLRGRVKVVQRAMPLPYLGGRGDAEVCEHDA